MKLLRKHTGLSLAYSFPVTADHILHMCIKARGRVTLCESLIRLSLIGCVNLQSGQEGTQPQPLFSLLQTILCVVTKTTCVLIISCTIYHDTEHAHYCYHGDFKVLTLTVCFCAAFRTSRTITITTCHKSFSVCVFLSAGKDTPAGADCGGHRCGSPAQPPGELQFSSSTLS